MIVGFAATHLKHLSYIYNLRLRTYEDPAVREDFAPLQWTVVYFPWNRLQMSSRRLYSTACKNVSLYMIRIHKLKTRDLVRSCNEILNWPIEHQSRHGTSQNESANSWVFFTVMRIRFLYKENKKKKRFIYKVGFINNTVTKINCCKKNCSQLML